MNLAYALTILGTGGATLVSASKNHDYEFNSSEYYWHTHVIYHYFIIPIYMLFSTYIISYHLQNLSLHTINTNTNTNTNTIL